MGGSVHLARRTTRLTLLLVTLALASSACTWIVRASVSERGPKATRPAPCRRSAGTGAFVAFTSAASNLVAGDTNNLPDVFVRDNRTGQVERVNVDSTGGQANGNSYPTDISENGRYVAFSSRASNLVAGDTNNQPDVFVHDRITGVTERVSTGQRLGDLRASDLSADGHYVVFVSSNPSQTNVVDRQSGTTRAFPTPCGGGAAAPISDDGRYVALTAPCVPGPALVGVRPPNVDRVRVRRGIADDLWGRAVRSVRAGDVHDSPTDGYYVTVFVRDLVAGSVEPVSVTSSENQIPDGSSMVQAILGRRPVHRLLQPGRVSCPRTRTAGRTATYGIEWRKHVPGGSRIRRPGRRRRFGQRRRHLERRSLSRVLFSAPNLIRGDTNGWNDVFVARSAARGLFGGARVGGARNDDDDCRAGRVSAPVLEGRHHRRRGVGELGDVGCPSSSSRFRSPSRRMLRPDGEVCWSIFSGTGAGAGAWGGCSGCPTVT